MNDLQIRALDPASADFVPEVTRWHAAYLASVTFGRDDAAPYLLPEIRDLAQTPTPQRWVGLWSAERAGVVVGAGLLDLSLTDNLSLVTLGIQVVPEERRRGVGSALADALETAARDRGRTVAIAEVEYSLEDPEDGAGTPPVLFGAGRGYALALHEIQRRVALPIDEALLAGLVDEAAPHHVGYAIETFHGTVPDRRVAGLAAISSELLVHAPSGDLTLEQEDPSVSGWRAREAAVARQEREMWHAIALLGDEVVAYTTLSVPTDGSCTYQWGTMVRPDHRGHRLGLAVKAANHLALQAAGVRSDAVATWNATENGPMIAINDRLGFVPVGRLGEVQKQL